MSCMVAESVIRKKSLYILAPPISIAFLSLSTKINAFYMTSVACVQTSLISFALRVKQMKYETSAGRLD